MGNCEKTLDLQPLEQVLACYSHPEENLIALLQDIQEAYGYLPQPVLVTLREKTGIPAAQLMGVASFYAQFRAFAPGRYQISLCQGTACHVNGSAKIALALADATGVAEGHTGKDGLFSWENVACLGCCSLAPVMLEGGQAYGKLTPEKTRKIIEGLRSDAVKRAGL
ncbi:MAG: NAD(P)H-dependent oxidoreductase subunit E [Clostridiales bacterium]|nr:NAD(P)H-dependent oxidoreductase subunit E [Clostridiales bacterium]